MLISCSESFPNDVAEAMLCEKHCLVTNVGDAVLIVEDSGVLVKPQNSQDLLDGIIKMLEFGRDGVRLKGMAARKIVVNKYSIKKMSEKYNSLYFRSIGLQKFTR